MSIIQQNKKIRKWTVGIVLVFFILTQVFGGIFFYVKPAMAQLVVADPVTGAQTTIRNIQDFLKVLVVNAGTMALINAASRFMQKISYDLAVSIASGGGGQMPLFSTEGWGDYMKNAGLDAAGEFIGSFGDMVGVDFCAPPNPRVGLNLQLSLGSIYSGELPAPTCKWSEISSNWDSFVSEVQSEDFLREMASQFRVSYEAGTDLDLAMTGFIGAFDQSTSAERSAKQTREEGQGFLPSSEFISGKVKTPAEVIRQTSEIQTKGPVEAEQLKWSLSGQAMSAGAQGILVMVASTFVSTLLSKTMERVFSKGFYSLADLFPKGESTTSEGTAWGGRRAAELAFADLLVPQIKEGGAYDILTDFIVCPDKFKGVNNCVMDGNFEAAVRRAQTGEPLTISEAIDEKLLHGEWPIIPPSNLAKNQDPYCYTYGYCYSNLVKLRKARIIPIGWEIAAQSQTSTEPVSLKEVVDKFRDCNADDEADAEHKYCHLIDPDWILKAPLGQCRARVYGPLLQTAENSFRQEVCVDAPTCIAEDDKGNCQGGWGYCTREKNIWRLDGDQCDAEYDTCRALTRRDGQNVAYTINTIDYGPPCNADDIGCRWYSKRQSKVADVWLWQDTLTGSGTAARRNDRIFFNKNITQCDEPGCNEFLRTTADTRLNLVANSSFENFTGTIDDGVKDSFPSWPAPWGTYGDPNAEAVSGTYLGQAALKAGGVVGQSVNLGGSREGRTFTLSLYAKGCSETSTFDFGGVTRRTLSLAAPGSSLSQWSRFSVTRTFSDSATTIDVAFYNASVPGDTCLIDAVQLEEGSFASPYHEGWGRTGEALYLKTAPEYYSCYDYTGSGALNKTNDAEQCGNYAAACEEKDVGCEQYTPTNGDPFVPGVANYPDDYCPAECVGYQTFKQVATDFEQDKFPVYFIPSTGRTCSAADVGCDQFTSLETEAVANFNYVRRCEKPGATSAPFYTWEGSDTTGYQLKTWSLKVGANYDPADPTILYSPDGGTGPCTKLNVTDTSLCADDGITGICTKADTLTNPDCREFYDAAGKKHYRLYSKTIVATDDCHPYRKTVSSASDCAASAGRWDETKNECVYQVYLPESQSCSNEAVGCRAYRGNAGANTAVIFTTNFDDATLNGWSAGSSSSESLVVGGKSLSLTSGTTTTKDISTSVRKGGLYTLSFWAKGDSRLDIKFSGAGSGREFSSATTSPTNLSFDWRYFSLGPVYVGGDAPVETLQITAVGGASPAYLDNIILREIQSYIYVVKNSWATPTSCDSSFTVDSSATDATACTASGGSWSSDRNECILAARLPQAQLGCASYYDRTNRLHYLKSFSRLCPVEVAGCEKLIKTGNNDAVAEEIFNTENDVNNPATPADETQGLSAEERFSDNVTIPTDSFAYIVVNDANKCAVQNAGCAEFGSPTLDATGNVKLDDSGKPMYDTVNLLADPTLYNSATGRILCQVGFLSCEEYATTDGGKLYFKDPEPRLCEWKDNVLVLGQSVSGWFKKGIDPLEPCDPANFNGGYYNIWKNGDANCTLPFVCQDAPGGADIDGGGDGFCACSVPTTETPSPGRKPGTTCTVSYGKRTCPYSGWVGECIPQADKCTKFVDPADTSEDLAGEPYYYINNSKISEGNCNGMVSQKEGCVLFNDTSNPQLDKNADATYWASEKKIGDPGGLVAPLDCQTSDSCKRCFRPSPGGGPPFFLGDYCQQSTDCPSGYTCSVMHEIYSLLLSFRIAERTDVVIDELMPGKVFKLNNSNRLVQVRRDRVCGEWLTCSGTNHTFDSQTGREKVLCNKVTACSQYAKVGQATTQCTNQVDRPETYNQILSKDLYVSRDVTFKGMDYSGDSIYNQYQAPDLRGVNIGTDENPVLALVFVDDRCFDDSDPARVMSCATHPSGFCASETNGSRCGDDGKCFNNICVTNFRGDPFAPGALLTLDESNAEKTSCRAYPEQSSPFPSLVAVWDENGNLKSKKAGFTGANVCEDDENCECSYKKISYSSGAVTKYFSQDQGTLPAVCIGGPKPGQTCDPLAGSTDPDGCGEGGQCVTPQREDTVIGWSGFCLERDTSTSINGDPKQLACLTWYPTDQIPGMPDIYNNYPEAGFESSGFNYYCLQPGLYKNLKSKDAYDCLDASEDWECDPDDRDACKQAHCPAGYVTIVGACQEWTERACEGVTYDDCPYKCVPINSYHTGSRDTGDIQWEAGTSCFPDAEHATANFPPLPSGDLPQLTSWLDEDGLTGLRSGGNYRDTNDRRYDDCERKGAAYSTVNATTVDSQYFVGCREVAQINKESDLLENQAWTNRLWLKPATSTAPGQFYSIEVPTSGRTPAQIAKLQYSYKSLVDPFGKINQESRTVDLPNISPQFPMEVKVCRAGPSGAPSWTWSLPSVDPDLDCPSPTEDVPISPITSSSNEGRPFTLITTTADSRVGTACPDNAGCNSPPGDICRDQKCYQACVSDVDCVSGNCVSAPRDPNLNIKYCDEIEISAGDGRACGTGGGIWVGECDGAPYDGEKCRVAESCWANLCKEGHCYDRGTEPGRARLTPTIEDISLGIEAFKQLFAKIYIIWEWDTVNNKYIEKSTEPFDEDITEKRGTAPGPSGSQWPSPPSIWAITDCTGEKCVLGTPDAVSINGIDGNGLTSGGSTEPINVVGYGEASVTMQFFGTADPNAGPLKKITVDWGDDGDRVVTTGRYKNHLGRDACNNSDFAHSTGACTDEYFYYTNTYTCPADASTTVRACTSDITTNCFAAVCPEDVNAGLDGTGSCCVFKPRVQLMDNWNWCNGSCPGGPGGDRPGCYFLECAYADGPWTSFAGRVIVVPK
jgi:hypothetical protein